MNVKLPNGEKIYLDDICSFQKKIFMVNNLLSKWDEYIIENWKKGKVKHFVSCLGTYLINHKDPFDKDKWRNNRYILSPFKMKNMKSFKAKSIPFSSLDDSDQVLVGHTDYKDTDNE